MTFLFLPLRGARQTILGCAATSRSTTRPSSSLEAELLELITSKWHSWVSNVERTTQIKAKGQNLRVSLRAGRQELEAARSESQWASCSSCTLQDWAIDLTTTCSFKSSAQARSWLAALDLCLAFSCIPLLYARLNTILHT
jgi:hypothetical protein